MNQRYDWEHAIIIIEINMRKIISDDTSMGFINSLSYGYGDLPQMRHPKKHCKLVFT